MTKINVQIKGMAKIRRNLHKLDIKTLRKLNNAVHNAGLLIEESAQRNAPVDSGELRARIKTDNKRFLHSNVTSHVDYSAYVEDMGPRRGKKQGKMPYMQPAVDDNIAKINRMIARAVRDAIKNV